MTTVSAYNTELRRLLGKLRNRTIALQAAAGTVSFIALAAWIYVAIVIWSVTAGEPPLWKTTLVSYSTGAVLLAVFGYLVVWPVLRVPRLDDLADEVENRRDLQEILRAGFEFSRDKKASGRYSPALVDEVVFRAVKSIDGLRVRFLFLGAKDIALIPFAYGGLAVLLLIALFSPTAFVNAGRYLASPASVSTINYRANIHAWPGDITVLAGSDVTVAGLDLGRAREDVTINYNLSEDFWKTEPTIHKSGPEAGFDDVRSDDWSAIDRYEYTFVDLRHTVSYYFRSGDYQSETRTITVVHKPILTDLSLILTPPAYTGEPADTLNDNGGNIQALEGTRVAVSGEANNPLAGAWVRFGDTEPREIDHEGRTVSFDFQVLEDGHYGVILEDTIGYKTDDPLLYTIDVYQDHAPSLDVLEPGGNTDLPRSRRLPLGFIATDDYGVRQAAVYFRSSGDEQFDRTAIPLAGQRDRKEIAVAWEWDLGPVELFPGDYIEYYVEVADNNVVTGPGITRSRLFQIFVPTMAEMYDRISEEDERRDDLFEQAIKESEEFRERLDKITREYVKTEKMEWSQKKEIDKALEKHKSVEDALDDIKKSLDETMQELSENRMTSQQIGEKLEEIRQLLEEIDSEELRNYMEQLRESIEKLSPEDIRDALEKIDVSAEEMLEKLERTAQLLKQIQNEQKMEEIVRKAQDLMQSQKELGDETSDADSGDESAMNELADKQEDLARRADDLQKSMENFSEKVSDVDPEIAQQMREASQQMQSGESPQKNMRRAAGDLQMLQKQQAMQQQQQAMDKLISLFQQAARAQEAMGQNAGRRMAANLQKYAKQTLDLSFKQEQLAARLQSEQSDRSADFQETAQTQNSYLDATKKIADEIAKLSAMSLSVPRTLMEALGVTIERMQNSVLFLEQNRPFMSTAHAVNATESLNEATIEMLRSAQQCSKSGCSSGQQTARQLLQQMIPQQQDIMKQTRSMMELEAAAERLRQERQAQLDKLSGEQRSLKELAEEIQKSLNENEELLGRLDRTVQDMEEVSRSLERGNLDDNLIRKQQRILSRLLDAQRSVYTRDYEQQRQSITAEEIFSKSLGNRKSAPEAQSLREEIRRAMQLKAPGEFEDLIRMYFRALAEESAADDGAKQ